MFTSTHRISAVARQFLGIQSCRFHLSVTRCDTQKTEKTINQVTLLGRVGSDPQKRGSEEHPVINFPLATHFSYKYESGDILQRTDWHRVSVFKPGLRDTVYKYLKKGQRVYVTGKLSYGEIKLDDGQVRTASTVVADDIIFFQTQPVDVSAGNGCSVTSYDFDPNLYKDGESKIKACARDVFYFLSCSLLLESISRGEHWIKRIEPTQ